MAAVTVNVQEYKGCLLDRSSDLLDFKLTSEQCYEWTKLQGEYSLDIATCSMPGRTCAICDQSSADSLHFLRFPSRYVSMYIPTGFVEAIHSYFVSRGNVDKLTREFKI